MTTDVSTPDGVGSPELGAVDPFQGLRSLLPRLAVPSWVWLIAVARLHRATASRTTSPAAERAIRRNERKRSRFARALAGQHTRARKRAVVE